MAHRHQSTPLVARGDGGIDNKGREVSVKKGLI
jgi:hypothetical protein